MGSRPVRIGNGAYGQLQLDIYGELMDSVYLSNKYGSPISYDLWMHLRELIDWVAKNWQRKDEGIWEVRGGQQHFRLLEAHVLGSARPWPPARRQALLPCRSSSLGKSPRSDLRRESWPRVGMRKRQAFVQYYGSDTLDAANLMMPLVFFLSPTDPRNLKTLGRHDALTQRGGAAIQ